MVVLFSRVLEHSSICGLACLDHVLSHVDKAATQQVILWSDGPRMFKSTEYLAGSIGLLQTRPNVMKVTHNYGFPKHVRGTHDGMFGVAKHVFEDAIRALPDGNVIGKLEEAVAIYQWSQWSQLEPVGTAFKSIVQFESPLRAMRIAVIFNI